MKCAATRNSKRRSSLLVLVIAGAAMAGGCNQGRHGSYTREGAEIAQLRLAQLKSGTEWQMAQQQYLGGDLDKALKTVDRSIALNPGVAKSHVLKGRILLEKGALEKSKESLEHALTLQPENVEAHYFLGIVHERFSMDEKALSFYQKASELEPSNPQYVLAWSEMFVNLQRIDEAQELLLSKKESFGYSAAIRQTLGHIAVLKGDHDTAANYFNDALLLAPEDPAILEDLARSQIATGRFGDAEFNLARLCRLPDHSDRRDLKLLRARCLMAIDRPLEARTILQELTSTQDGENDLEAWVELGNAAVILKDKRTLNITSKRCTGLMPSRFEGHFFRGAYFNLENQKTEALSALDQAIQRSYQSSAPFVLKASILNELGRNQEAIDTLAAANERFPQDRVVASLRMRFEHSTVTGVSTDTGE